MRLPLLCALNFAVLAGGMTTTASDLSRPLGDLQLERPTLRSLGVYWIIQGDDNQNAFIGLEYRKAGSSPWRTAARLFRVERRAHLMERSGSELEVPDDGWLFVGSALLLEPRAAYELRLTLEDPDGGKATRTLRASTRSEPLVSTTARGRHVVPGLGGGAVTERDPFRGRAAAQKAEAPGDLFVVRHCHIRRVDYGITATRNTQGTAADHFISDNHHRSDHLGMTMNGPGFAAKTTLSESKTTYYRFVQTKELKR